MERVLGGLESRDEIMVSKLAGLAIESLRKSVLVKTSVSWGACLCTTKSVYRRCLEWEVERKAKTEKEGSPF